MRDAIVYVTAYLGGEVFMEWRFFDLRCFSDHYPSE